MAHGDGFIGITPYPHSTTTTTATPTWPRPPDVCDCDQRCPHCGKLKPTTPRIVYYPIDPYQPQRPYWFRPDGGPTC